MEKKELRFAEIIAGSGRQNGSKEMRASLGMVTSEKTLDIMSPLLNKLVLKDAGATILTGLSIQKNYKLPFVSGSPAYWLEVGEGVPAVFGGIQLAPHKLIAQFEISTLLTLQTEGAIDKVLIDFATAAMAAEVEKAILGDGNTGDRPDGIFNVAGVLAATHAGMIDLIHNIEGTNAKTGAFVVNADIAKTLRLAEKSGGLVLDSNRINGYPCFVTDSAAGLAFGNWKDLVVAFYDGIDIVSDPFTKALEAITIVTISFSVAAHLLKDESIVRVA